MPVVDATNIPESATRIRMRGTYLDAASARAALERYPHLREEEITVDCGPVPLHMRSGPARSVRWTAWSDGLIIHGDVWPLPADLPDRLSAAEGLMRHVIREARFGQEGGRTVPPGMWLRWLDATGTTIEDVAGSVDERAVGPDRTATRIVALTRHTVHCADGRDDAVWVLREQVQLPEMPGAPLRAFGTGAMAAVTRVMDDEAAARAAFTARDDHRPPVVTSTEAAAVLGASPDALRQAISRARRNSWHPFSRSVGRTNWYVMDHIAEMWNARPGHGPGRGHARPAE